MRKAQCELSVPTFAESNRGAAVGVSCFSYALTRAFRQCATRNCRRGKTTSRLCSCRVRSVLH
eukprot:9796870-Alexandrium_andersonii.AAC.1